MSQKCAPAGIKRQTHAVAPVGSGPSDMLKKRQESAGVGSWSLIFLTLFINCDKVAKVPLKCGFLKGFDVMANAASFRTSDLKGGMSFFSLWRWFS